jgi:hypothetical protein
LTIVVTKDSTQLRGFHMFGSSGAHELGYVSSAVVIALIRKLVSTGALTQDEAAELLNDAATMLSPAGHTSAVAGAMRLLDDIKYRVAA